MFKNSNFEIISPKNETQQFSQPTSPKAVVNKNQPCKQLAAVKYDGPEGLGTGKCHTNWMS